MWFIIDNNHFGTTFVLFCFRWKVITLLLIISWHLTLIQKAAWSCLSFINLHIFLWVIFLHNWDVKFNHIVTFVITLTFLYCRLFVLGVSIYFNFVYCLIVVVIFRSINDVTHVLDGCLLALSSKTRRCFRWDIKASSSVDMLLFGQSIVNLLLNVSNIYWLFKFLIIFGTITTAKVIDNLNIF